MIVRFHEDAERFGEITRPFLMEAEAENNLMLGLLPQIAAGDFDDYWIASIESEDDVIRGCAIQTSPHGALLTNMPSAGTIALVSELLHRVPKVTGVVGPTAPCEIFADAWCWETNAKFQVAMTQGVFQLDRVVKPSRAAQGRFRPMVLEDVDQVAAWHGGFVDDTGIPDARDGHEVARKLLARRSLFIWEDAAKPVSMAGFSGPTPNGIRVNFVYTPPECRGRGYASACVAALSQHLLDGGRTFCFLYTDLQNPTSNAIYRAMGYRKVSDSVMLTFDYG